MNVDGMAKPGVSAGLDVREALYVLILFLPIGTAGVCGWPGRKMVWGRGVTKIRYQPCAVCPYSGKIMMRISPDVHARAAKAAELSGKSLNQWAEEALDKAATQTPSQTPRLPPS